MSENRPKNWKPGRGRSDRARLVAYRVLLKVIEDDAYANLLLPKELTRGNFNKQDASYATNLCYGTLRLQSRWDYIISQCTQGRDISELDPEVRVILRLGAHQLLALQTPAYAVIYEMVQLARNELGSGASGFINAVLRRISERSLRQWRDLIATKCGGVSTIKFIAIWFSHPEWIVRAFVKSLLANGRTGKDLVAVLKANNEPADVALVARNISLIELAADIERGKMASAPGKLVNSALLLKGGDPHRVFAVQDRLAGVQDEGSQLVAKVVANAPLSGADKLWLDMCAGPGGKTATMATLAARRGATINANELHAHRLKLVAKAVEPWGDLVALREGDGRELGVQENNIYDRILVDAPCSGIGSLRRRPESRWRKNPQDLLELTSLQYELLESAWKAVRNGGIIGYSTCSPHLKETRDIVEKFLRAHPQAELLDTPKIANSQSLSDITGVDKHLQLWPDLHNADAMYLALIRKNN